MKIYNISLGQLITFWVFGIPLCLWLADKNYQSTIEIVFACLIPCFLVFYSLGWKNRREKPKE